MCFIRLPEKSLKFVFVCVGGMWGWGGGGVGKIRMKILKSSTMIN